MKHNRKILILLVCLLAVISVWIVWGNITVGVSHFTITDSSIPDSFSGFKIAQVSDLHNDEFGKGNEKLVSIIENESPDIIVVTGDLVDSYDTDTDIAVAFMEKVTDIAPCYYVTGNHEARLDEETYMSLETSMEELGVTVLRDESVELEKDGENIQLIGIDDPDFSQDMSEYFSSEDIVDSLLSTVDIGEGYTILLSHRPEAFDIYEEYGISLVFTGHAHGGQFRLPFVGGLVAPDQGIFPKYDSGIYESGNTSMIVSRGLGNSIFPFRINNRPELVIVELEQ